ncbi:FHA domain-containing protein [Pseudanabaena sp. UWO310]|uniref:FHA domain-containing protein n=1 Tax=Pseudanabaena sp. UWO310 TaxID=2480795 RepID=UPI00115BB813|nr:FHA domain-containing protein [Pseudanabaena sp. UWO310]TYQ30286.1 FHA domain-containing protein [Pseudanabaena sp. UWO310]
MIKLRIFNIQIPQELKPIELSIEKSKKNDFLFGRAPQCDVFLDNSTVSRHHGKIFFEDEQYHYLDLGSTNGSQINNLVLTQFRPFRLSVNDTIQLGDFAILIEEIKLPTRPIKILEEEEDPTEPSVSHLEQPIVTIQKSSDRPVAVEHQHELQPIEYWTEGSIALECTRIVDETEDVKTFSFVANPIRLFRYQSGQFLNLSLEINGVELMGSYPIASSPSRPYALEITVKRPPTTNNQATEATMSEGLISNWLHYNLTVGSRIRSHGFLGSFNCTDNPSQKLLLLSAGIGSAPMLSISRWLYDTHADCDITFLHSARSPQEIIFRQELEIMATRSPKFHLAINITHLKSRSAWLGLRGKLTSEMLTMIAPDWRDRPTFVCGSDSFIQSTKSLLETMGFDMTQYHAQSLQEVIYKNQARALVSP